ncbi:hypothetical protein KAM448_37790 [Aeromonas caviae]|uniref:Uncharacterized protein n=1 Tax=Aeromonas caviae TaxID=648 RepID=A0ABD0BCL0_AERCA|nr:hypothetical protein [Aeromonas caviae]GJA83375.1 hypothetical protein KAM355_39350 [Aeromonas caviae]GJB00807.1 hypothetical protein KAM359_42140 [Aeromonas caviae]GJB13458.1 hypothetical protein KAM362_40180 [Aeromonas caviae]GJB26220.1 hypothetical protein KAM365_39700 [Aeromonas caviae]GJB43719.1 hypothetical protein KAM369_41940 [Aeromonas caviae]
MNIDSRSFEISEKILPLDLDQLNGWRDVTDTFGLTPFELPHQAALFPKSTIKPQLPQPQVTVTLGAF